jgi:hypothetical protein
MSGIEQRIADILRYADLPFTLRPRYKWKADEASEFFEAAAEVLVSELGLIQENAFRFTHKESGRSSILDDPGDVRIARKITESHNLTEVSRFVTEWVPE